MGKQTSLRRPSPARAGRRTVTRELALQILYQSEYNPGQRRTASGLPPLPEPESENHLHEGEETTAITSTVDNAYAARLVDGANKNKEQLDELIAGTLEHWDIKRLAVIDLVILRLAAYELVHCPDVPPAVVINEAIEMAKKYADKRSPAFINGILDKISKSPK